MKHVLFACACSVLITACATPRTFNHIDADARSSLKSAETVLVVTQSEIGSDINVSNVQAATGGGLLGAVIDASVNSKRTKVAEETVGPIRDKLIDYDFATVFESSLKSELSSTPIEGLGNVELRRATDKDMAEGVMAETSSDAVLFVDTTYNFSPDFSRIIARASVAMYPKSAALFAYREKNKDDGDYTDLKDNIYRNSVVHEENLLSATSELEQNAARVLEMDTSELEAVLNRAAAGLADAISHDVMVDDAEPVEIK